MNTKMENFELQSNWVEKAQNCRFEEELGAVRKREAISYFNGISLGSTSIVGLYRFYKSDGTTKFIAISGTGVYAGDDSDGTFDLIRTLTNTGKRCSFIAYDDLLMGFNGYDNNFVYDGTSDNVTWELGACKSVAGAGTGITRTAISYKITWDTDAIITGAVSNTIATVANKSIELTNIPLGPVGCANRKIYRQSSETSGYRLLTTLSDNTTTIYTDTTDDISAGTALGAVTDDAPVGNIPVMFRERLFLVGDPSNPNTIYYSYPYLPHIMLQTTGPDTLEVSPDDNDEITGLGIVMGSMACIKKNNLRKLYVAGPDSSWYAEDPLMYVGTPAPWSVINTSQGLVFLGWDHWYLFNGATVTPIIDEFDTMEILSANYSSVIAFYHNDHILAAYTDSTLGTQYHNRVMRYSLKRSKLSYDTINANCFTAKRGGDETGELFYGSSIEGFVYKGSNEELVYRLNNKTNANLGTKTNTFVGGIESDPYIEIGAISNAESIPVDLCILWDSISTSPGSGWTEITDRDNHFVLISGSTPGTVGAIGGSEADVVQLASTTHTYSGGNTTEANCIDGSYTTSYGKATGNVYPAAADLTVIATHTFTEAHDITTFKFKCYATGYNYGDSSSSHSNYLFEYQTASGWTTLDTRSASIDGDGSATCDSLTWYPAYAITGTYTGVTAIRITCHAGASSSGGDGNNASASCYIYEMQAYGVVSTDTPYRNYRCFKKNNTTVEDQVPTGSILIWDQATPPEGFIATGNIGEYIRINSSNVDTGTIQTSDLTNANDNMLDAFLIKKIGEASTWDGLNQYVYALSYSTVITADSPSQSASSSPSSSPSPSQSPSLSSSASPSQSTSPSSSYSPSRSVSVSPSSSYSPSISQSISPSPTSSISPSPSYSPSRSVSVSPSLSPSQSASSSISQSVSPSVSPSLSITGDWEDITDWFAGKYLKTKSSGDLETSVGIFNAGSLFTTVSFHLCKKVLGKMQDWNDAIDTQYTSGIWESPTIQINAGSLGKLFWNETLVGSDHLIVEFKTGATEAACIAASYGADATDPNGTLLSDYTTANLWIRYKITFTAADTRTSNPRMYFADGFLIKFFYSQSAVVAEDSVEFIYSLGYRNFDLPMMDKIHKKIEIIHEGSLGSFKVQWATENADDEFAVDLNAYPERWSSFFQDTAMGEKFNITIYKNDLHDFILKEINGFYSLEPLII